MGFSKGGIAAVYSVYVPIRDRIATKGREFALHVAYYPWCGLLLRQPVTTGAPVLIQSGALDDVVPAERCQDLVNTSRSADGPPNMKVIVHPNARHGFDHPLLSMFGKLPLSEASPAHCLLEEQSDGQFRERQTGLLVNRENLRETLVLCSRGGAAGGNADAAEQAFVQTLTFLNESGFLVPAPMAPSLSAGN
jgi:dienelactone hydrolase